MTVPASVLGTTPASTVSVAASAPRPGAVPNSDAHEHLQIDAVNAALQAFGG